MAVMVLKDAIQNAEKSLYYKGFRHFLIIFVSVSLTKRHLKANRGTIKYWSKKTHFLYLPSPTIRGTLLHSFRNEFAKNTWPYQSLRAHSLQ